MPNPNPAPPPNPTPPPAPPPNPAPPADPPAPAADRTFNQADVDRIVQERLGRDRQRFADYDDLKAKAAKLEEIEASSKSDLEKATERAAKAEQEAQQIRDTANRRLVQAAVIAAATKANAIKPEHMPRLIEAGSVTVGDDGQVTGAEDAVKAFLEANPEYVGTTARPAGAADQGPRPGPEQITSTEGMSSEEIVKALEDGRLSGYLSST